MSERNCVVRYMDSFAVEHAAKVEAESLFEAAVREFGPNVGERMATHFRT